MTVNDIVFSSFEDSINHTFNNCFKDFKSPQAMSNNSQRLMLGDAPSTPERNAR